MENNVIDLKKVEAETAEKIAAVNAQKVTIVTLFIAQMKVRVAPLNWGAWVWQPGLFILSRFVLLRIHKVSNFSCCFFIVAEGQAHDGEGAPGSGDGGTDCWEDQAGARLQGRHVWAQESGSKKRMHTHKREPTRTLIQQHLVCCVVSAKIWASGTEEGAAEWTVQNFAAESQGHLQHDGWPVVAWTPAHGLDLEWLTLFLTGSFYCCCC